MPRHSDRRPCEEARRQRTQRPRHPGKRPCEPAESRLGDFCPLAPTKHQEKFLQSTPREAFYGGAAGGGKSTALLMGALQHAYVPGYAALILRRDTQRLHLAGGLIPRSHEWLVGTQARWNAGRCQWTFPTGGPPATITFGYLQSPLDKFRYGSSEYQYIAFDELTEFCEEDYLFLFSRLRRTKGLSAPLRIRSASNPGGPGHLWVKTRFVDEESLRQAALAAGRDAQAGRITFHFDRRDYTPARIADNPHLDGKQYRQSLHHLPPVTRERLLNGDWSIQANGLIQPQWLRYYVPEDGQLQVLDPRRVTAFAARERGCWRFCTIDPAGTAAERVAASGRPHSWSVIQIWDQPPCELARFLFLRHQWRKQAGIVELIAAIRDIRDRFRPQEIYVEQERLGVALCDLLKQHDMRVTQVPAEGKDKETRARPLIVKFSEGEILLPRHDISWRPDFEAEVLAWTGDKRQPCDQIDAAAYAAIIAERRRPQGAVVLEKLELP